MIKWALAPIVKGERATEMDLATLEGARENSEPAWRQPLLSEKTICQRALALRDGGLALTSAVGIRSTAYLEWQALVLAGVVMPSSGASPAGLLDKLYEPSLAKTLVGEPRFVVHYPKR